MHQKNLPTIPTCKCGSQDFETVFGGRNHLGRYEYRIACRSCKTVITVGKSTYALFRYLNNYKPSHPFLKLFDLDKEPCQ
ncbi:hypothetical protein EHM69_12395 [candidate division KSB1 bacterium]|nr:MAG: hypothetical protein EHM69_12395 [candidate division KSB1 bacterium]